MKVREKDTPSAQQSRFMKLFKQLRCEIGLKDALIEMPKFNKWLSTLLRNKEKLGEIAIITINVECYAIILNKAPEKLEDPGKFLIPCALQELDRTNALADSGASINLLPHSIYKQLGLGTLKPTQGLPIQFQQCTSPTEKEGLLGSGILDDIELEQPVLPEYPDSRPKNFLPLPYNIHLYPVSRDFAIAVRRIDFIEYAVLFGKQIRCLDCKTRYDVLSRRLDTSYPTGGYGVSGDQSKQNTI
ncbi:reverse transcriptase domain-containing protein [Tanacetum coccineum]